MAGTRNMIAKRYILFTILTLIVAATVLSIIRMRSTQPADQLRPEEPLSLTDSKPAHTTLVHLYFSDTQNQFLIAEERALQHPENPAFFARMILEALIKGPQRGLVRTMPEHIKIRAIYVAPTGICYVDLASEVTEKHPGGIKSEMLSVYSIVNSLVLNIPEIEAVKILINGNESMTLAGHIDLQLPVKANMLLIR
jgi:spore germination protein GerM